VATVCLTLLGNAAICGVISGPHDRYGSRLVWIATLALMIAAMKRFKGPLIGAPSNMSDIDT
jgi:hypothetical protein